MSKSLCHLVYDICITVSSDVLCTVETSVYCDVQCLNHSVLWCIMYHSFYTHNVCITVSSDVRVLCLYHDVLRCTIYHSVSLMYDVSITVYNVCITLSAMLNVSRLPCHWAHIAISMFPTCRISLLCTLYCIYTVQHTVNLFPWFSDQKSQYCITCVIQDKSLPVYRAACGWQTTTRKRLPVVVDWFSYF